MPCKEVRFTFGTKEVQRKGAGKKKNSQQVGPVLLTEKEKKNLVAIEVLVFKACCCALLLHAHGQVDKSEDVVLYHDGEAEENGIQDQDVHTQLEIQPPLVQVDPQHLQTKQKCWASSIVVQ